MFEPPGILVISGRKTLANLQYRKHAAHFDRAELSEARHHGKCVVWERHFHLAHVRHAFIAHRHVARHSFRDFLLHAA